MRYKHVHVISPNDGQSMVAVKPAMTQSGVSKGREQVCVHAVGMQTLAIVVIALI